MNATTPTRNAQAGFAPALGSRFRWTPEADRDLRRLVEDEWQWQWPGWKWVASMMDGGQREGTFTAAQCRARYTRILSASDKVSHER